MIDVVINEKGGMSIIHDNPRLDSMTRLLCDGRNLHLFNELKETFFVGQLSRDMLGKIHKGMKVRLIRMNDWSYGKISDLSLFIKPVKTT